MIYLERYIPNHNSMYPCVDYQGLDSIFSGLLSQCRALSGFRQGRCEVLDHEPI